MVLKKQTSKSMSNWF